MASKSKNKSTAATANKSPETKKEDNTSTTITTVTADTTTATETPKVTSAELKKQERADAKAAKDAERETKKAARIAERAAKKAAKPVRAASAHMAKVQKYELSLPAPSDEVKEMLEATTALSVGDLNVLASWVALEARKRATANSTGRKLSVGDQVRITSGNQTRYIGKEGTVSRTNRIRCFVTVPGFDREVYLFAGDVTVIEKATQQINISSDDTSSEKVAANG